MQLNFQNKKALVRVDFNVPLDKQYQITDDTRMRAAVPTIQEILKQGGSVILMSHLGRPIEKPNPDGSINKAKFTLRHLTAHLSELLGKNIQFAEDCVGESAQKMAAELRVGEILLLENTRFHEEEEKGNHEFAKKLASLGDLYVNDAFGTAHRAHASTTTVAHFFDKNHKCFGYLMDAELANAKRVLEQPARPLLAIVGGAKVSDKILLLERLMNLADKIIVGGGMAYTFMKAQGGHIGNSLCEDDRLELANELIIKAKEKGVEFLLPEDSIVADGYSNEANFTTADSKAVPDAWMALDIGEKACSAFREAILSSKTILWNGPMGVFEMSNFANGTNTVAHAIADATSAGAFSLIGGGDSVAALQQSGLTDRVSYVSTGGGAMLEFLEGKVLPGVAAILE